MSGPDFTQIHLKNLIAGYRKGWFAVIVAGGGISSYFSTQGQVCLDSFFT